MYLVIMAAPSCHILLLICISFFLSTFSGAGAARAYSHTPNVVYSDEDAAASPFNSYGISPGPISQAPNQGGGGGGGPDAPAAGTATLQVGGGGGDKSSSATTGLDVQPFSSVPTGKDTPAVNMFVQSTMQKSMTKTENFIDDVIEKRLKDPATDDQTKDCLNTCKDAYEDSMSAMKKTMEDVKDGNLYKANVDVSAMSSNADTCKDCMGQVYEKDDPQFKKFEAWIDGITDDCLNKITGLKN